MEKPHRNASVPFFFRNLDSIEKHMQELKKQLEILLVYYFREQLPTFPKGNLDAAESPDFILSLKKNRQKIGIELTRLNPGNASIPDKRQTEVNKEREHFIELAQHIFERENPHRLFVKFLFSDEVLITSERQMMASLQTAKLIRQALKNKKPGSFFQISLYDGELPQGIQNILIIGHPALTVSIWERSNNLGISNDVVDDIKKAIHKKDEKLKLYQKQRLNYYWLLITTDRLRGVKNFNLPNKIMNHHFQSLFQHVFLFDLIKAEVFELV
ncbi:hypothetical protein [Maribellus maritimus]|uniref:hypothetical protein n=1 Tax=Maribellus maritimus TaxID=2870838 RepID=UPI001EEABA1B|nr:hypothetical protein [Maribellus maritimus]MCG6187383.1 hypothetical protein [Maribellus maritimus]